MNSSPTTWTQLPLVPGTVSRARETALRNATATDTTGSVLDRVVRTAETDPGRTAVVDGDTVLSYADLLARTALIRAGLRSRGIGPGSVVAAVGPRSADTPAVFLALESLGACYLPVDPAWPAVRVRSVLARSRADLLLDYCDPQETAHAARSAAVAEKVPMARPAEAHEPAGEVEPIGLGDPDRSTETRYTIFTSGTTGTPKGATVEHRGMLNHLWAKVDDLELGGEDVVAFTAPLVFDISVWQMLCPLLVGGQVLVVRDRTLRLPRWLVDALEAAGTTVVELVPTVLGMVVDESGRRGRPVLTTLRRLLSTGEELHPALAGRIRAALPGAVVVNAYGPTECSDDVTHHVVTAADTTADRIPVGVPIAGTSLYLLTRAEDGRWRASEPGETGELFVGGICVGLGYANDEETTSRAFFRDPFDPDSPTGRLYRTGDLAEFSGGLAHYRGRSDRQVKVAGVRMELDEIESVLSRHPDIDRCAVVVSGDELVAHFSTRTPVSAEDLRKAVEAALPTAMVPRHWREWEALPLTHNGKTDHRALLAAPFGTESR
ncbi:amino acid adenylation domain-containing protein [Streptomyces venezuelae]|uniref:amino acid adenylation domain-containing protein n=1 Tax=Streptomyces venezuelae TaxID=54571 RepID=UPI00331BFEF5